MARTAGDKRRSDGFGIPWRLIIGPALVIAGGVGFLIYVAAGVDSVTGNIDRDADRWQIAYWKKPIPAQGQPPTTHLEQARGIHPENCGACHAAQYQDWRKSVHSLAMGPGVTGQFPSMSFAGQAQCLECHAPMSEQWGKLRDDKGNWQDNRTFDGALQAKGMVCSACHLRKHKRHGPPLPQGKAPVSQLVHGEPLRTRFFRASEFCKGCHQHPTTTLMINGKTVENTYQEWLNSPYPERGITCQGCHMPGGRHLWKGIHDSEMTRSGVSFSAALTSGKLAAGQRIEAELSLTNSGTGHAFPTYTTPAVFLKAAFLDKSGAILAGGHPGRGALRGEDHSAAAGHVLFALGRAVRHADSSRRVRETDILPQSARRRGRAVSVGVGGTGPFLYRILPCLPGRKGRFCGGRAIAGGTEELPGQPLSAVFAHLPRATGGSRGARTESGRRAARRVINT